jgi:hypothetical protein
MISYNDHFHLPPPCILPISPPPVSLLPISLLSISLFVLPEAFDKRYLSNPIVLQHVYCSQNNRPYGTIKHIHSSHLSFCSRLAICDHSRKLRPQSQLCDYCGCMFQLQLATLVASRPSQINIYIRPFWSHFLIPSCIFYLHANYTTVINSISNSIEG